MSTTPIKFPGLPTGLTLTCDVVHPQTLAVEETVTLTEASAVYSGNVTGAISGQKIFVMKASGSIIGSRLRTIEDTTATFIILSELETYASDGRGAYPVTITIDDGTDPVVGATVRITTTGLVTTKITDGSGIAMFALDNGTYDVTITMAGYGAGVESLTVLGATPETYSLTEIVVSPPASALVATGIMVVYDEDGAKEQGASISIKLTAGPGTAGYGFDTATRTDVSDADGLVTFPGMIRGATYSVWRGVAPETVTALFAQGSGSTESCVVPLDQDTFNLTEVIGEDAA